MAADSVIDGCVMGNKRYVLKAAINLQQLAFEDTAADAVCRGGGGGGSALSSYLTFIQSCFLLHYSIITTIRR